MSFGPFAHPGLLAGYHLDNVNDFSVNNLTLTNNGTTTFGPVKFGDGAILGSANYSKFLSRSDDVGINFASNFGVSLWFVLQTAPAANEEQYFFDIRSTSGTPRALIVGYRRTNFQQLELEVYSAGTNTYISYTFNLNTLYKLDVSYNGSGTIQIYINGNLIGTAAWGAGSNTYYAMAIGAKILPSSAYHFKGNIDEVMFLNYHRTPLEIKKRYAYETGKF